jgi:ATP-dependent protease HslVU (ClpYQ) peptidase subunit
MSTIVVVKKGNHVAIAADTLSTLGHTKCDSRYFDDKDKILRFGDSYIGVTGSTAHSNVLTSIIRKYPEHVCFDSTEDIFETYLRLHPILKEEFYLRPDEKEDDPYESSQIDALIANPHGIFGMYSWREVEAYSRFWAIGSGRDHALGAMYAVYDNLSNAVEIARVGVGAGCEFDDGTGFPITSYQIALGKLRNLRQKGKARRDKTGTDPRDE